MQPLVITAILFDGRVATTDDFLPLDSILAAEWLRIKLGDDFYNPPPPGQSEGWIEADLSNVLEKRGKGARWYWACSFNSVKHISEYMTYWNRRFDDGLEKYIDFKGRRGKVDAGSGRYKAYRMPLAIRLYPELKWYAVGDKKIVEQLLSGVNGIGKKQSQGFGLIKAWQAEECAEDYSEYGPGGLMRAVYDLKDGIKGIRRAYGVRPPYWRRENQDLVWVPGL